jgi:hypothetical protein
MVTCEKLAELDREKVAEVFDLLDRMHSGRPADPDLAKQIHAEGVAHCPFHRTDGELNEACLNGCRVEELIESGKLNP